MLRAYDLRDFERRQLRNETDSVIEEQRHLRQAYEEAITGVQEALGAAEGAARVRRQAVHGEPVAVVLSEITLHAPQLVVIGKCDPRAPHVEEGMMGRVGLRIASHAPVDVLVIS